MIGLRIGSLKRFVEIGRCFGWLDVDTWKTLFPPFNGWDVGCGYCAMEKDALKRGRCERHEVMRPDSKCGTFDVDEKAVQA